jgi:RNA polymerase sigma-70 factor (ECF subfamily)
MTIVPTCHVPERCVVYPSKRVQAEEFENHRRVLMGIAYRMLGSSAEAEDAVQNTWLRWRSTDRSSIVDTRAWLCKALVRICIDQLGSARVRRETYTGTWLPEPVLTTTPLDLESISLGLLVVLERLSPLERAVFLLHQVFDYTHAEVAEIAGTTEAACRQLLHRARRHVAAERPRFEVDRYDHTRLLQAFAEAVLQGELEAISNLLAEDVTLWGDGGGRVRGAILRPVLGRDKVARFFRGLPLKSNLTILAVEVADVNGWPALVGRLDAGVAFVVTIETDGARITAIRNVVNPQKLTLRSVD